MACTVEEDEEVLVEDEVGAHKIPMVTGNQGEEDAEVLECLSVLLNVADLCSLKSQRHITCLFNWYLKHT